MKTLGGGRESKFLNISVINRAFSSIKSFFLIQQSSVENARPRVTIRGVFTEKKHKLQFSL